MNTVAGFDMAESLDNNYKKIFDEAPDMIFVFDLETGMIVNCNKAASGVLGWQKDELIGRHQTFLQPSQEDIDFSPRRHNKGTGPGIDDYLEARVVKKDGTVFDAAIKTRFLELEGKKVVLGIFRNITKKKEYERELERISGFPDQDPNPVFRVNRDGAVMYANQAGRELLEYWQTGEGQSLPPLFRDPLLELGNGSATKYLEISIKEKTYQFAIQAVSGEDYFNIYSMDISERVNSDLALRRNVEMYSLTQKAANIGSWDWDVRNDHMYWSDNIESMLGLEKGTFKGDFAAFLELVHPDDRDYFETAVNNILKKAGDYNLEHRIILPDGSIRWLRENGMTIVDQSGQAIRMLGIVQDITRRREIMEQIAILSRAVEQSPVSVMITDLDGRIVYVNPKFSQISGYTREEVIGKNPRMLKSGQQRPGFYKELWETISAGKEWQGEFCNLDKFGRKFWERASISLLTDYWGNPLYYIAVKEDITERKKQERKIEFFALHDALTGLYNRISFMDHFKKSLNRAKRKGSQLALLYFDLDGFKPVNDRLGHAFGDKVLQKVAERLKNSIREMDVVARVGGDEFAILLPEFNHRREVEEIAERILVSISTPVHLEIACCQLGASIGISIFPDDGKSAGILLHQADKAMYKVKKTGRGDYQFCSESG